MTGPPLFTPLSGSVGDTLNPSAITKLYRRPWERYGRELGGSVVLPTSSATGNRRLCVTLERESDALASSRVDLAAAMAHSESTADRWYDRSVKVHTTKAARATMSALARQGQAASNVAGDVTGSGSDSEEIGPQTTSGVPRRLVPSYRSRWREHLARQTVRESRHRWSVLLWMSQTAR